jgi:hypothetical protein
MNEAGATTAEYAVGTLGAATIGAILIYVGLDPWYAELLEDVIQHALDPTGLLKHLESLPRPGQE